MKTLAYTYRLSNTTITKGFEMGLAVEEPEKLNLKLVLTLKALVVALLHLRISQAMELLNSFII